MTHIGFIRVGPIGPKSLVNFFYVISLVIKIFNDSSIKYWIFLAFKVETNISFFSIRVLKIIIIIIIIYY